MMNRDDFHEAIADRIDDIDVDAEDATHAVLAALALRLTPEEAADLVEELPDALGELVSDARGELEFERDGFVEDVAARLDLDDVDAERVALAVLGAVRAALEQQTSAEQVIEQLPSDLALLMHSTD